ncbi:Putative osmoprotectant uptake system ATP-binding protein YehX [Streptomyces sp. S4.7]|uniref:ATP-binding cassette domain-containing protein n=1 Tax=Streptomyces sp. S4.7 TaxID=2705439 RepID=UPI001396DE59|nr:ATP-binding cassette domain-containing protein [Streptomyces sp. S4.7]QHY98613.1 Putative osmoprotectant uptake system ATP-binding protein YehX [Streptomyces sp. S4.7]
MLQAIGLTSSPHRDLPPAVDDLTFEAPAGAVTALLGAEGAGKTTALRLMLELESGRGITYFRGRPLHRIAHPAREVGVLLGDVPGHPARSTKGQLRMLCAAAGVPAARADDLLELVGIGALRDEPLGALSLGMDRRLGLAAALLGDPHTLVLDEPAAGLSPRENGWLHGLLRAHAAHGGTVLYTTDDPKEAARTADRVVTLDEGRLVADQDIADFARTRLRPRVVVRTPHAARLADAVNREARADRRSVEVVTDSGGRLTVFGSDCAELGETAFRHGILVHQLADETGDTGPPAPVDPPAPSEARQAPSRPDTDLLPPPLSARPVRSPLRPFRYELRRFLGVRTPWLVAAVVLVASVALSLPLARAGDTPLPGLLAAWPGFLPLPPAALGAGLLGAFAFGDEYRYPALAAGRGTVPRRLGLLLAKLTVTAAAALLLAALTVTADAQAMRLVYGGGTDVVPPDWPALVVSWAGLTVGCAWAGLLGAGIFRVTGAGVAAVLAVPVVVVPLVQKGLAVPSARSIVGLPGRLRELAWPHWPEAVDRWLVATGRVVAQPVGTALALSLSALLCAYLFTSLRRRARW